MSNNNNNNGQRKGFSVVATMFVVLVFISGFIVYNSVEIATFLI